MSFHSKLKKLRYRECVPSLKGKFIDHLMLLLRATFILVRSYTQQIKHLKSTNLKSDVHVQGPVLTVP